jgi:hypothetical protein
MRFLILLLWCLVLPAYAVTNTVTFNLAEFSADPIKKRVLTIKPQSTPRTDPTSFIISSDTKSYATDTNGTVVVTNMVYGNYLCTIEGRFSQTQFRILVPDTNAALNAFNLLVSTNSVPSESAGYSQSQANARFAPANSALFSNVVYLNAASTPISSGAAFLAANTAITAGKLMVIGPGVFDVGSNIVTFKHDVTYQGQGMGVTIINGTNGVYPTVGPQFRPGSGTIRDLTIRTRDNNTVKYGFGYGQFPYQLVTNSLVERVWFEGDTDCIYMTRTADAIPSSILFRSCKFTSGYDVLWLGGSTNSLFEFVDCDFTITVSGQTNTLNSFQVANWLNVQGGDGQGSIVRFKRCSFNTINALNVFQLSGDTFGDGPYNDITWENCSSRHVLTNGGTLRGWSSPATFHTNNFLTFVGNADLFITTGTTAADLQWTNTPGPQTVTMMATGTRTNWLPPIHFVNNFTNMSGIEITVKDGAGTAGTTPIFVRALGSATINGSVSNVITANYGVKRYRNLGTNWITILE